MISIKDLKLGSDSAEKDIEVGLIRYFLKSNSYNNIVQGKTIIVGNRGAGKSAVFKYMASIERLNHNIVLELTPDEYSYEILSGVLKREKEGAWGKQGAYSVSWQYLLYNLVFKEITNVNTGFLTGPLKKIYNYVRDNLKATNINPIGLLISYLKRLEGIKIANYEASVKVQELQSLYDLEEINSLLPDLKIVLEKTKVFIFVDELDKGWDNSEDAKYFISGLIQASQKINLISKNLRVFVSIRQEIFDNIPQIYDDAQKIREDIEVIKWDEQALLEFISLRIVDSFPHLQTYSHIERWNMIFAEVLEYRGMKSFNYIIDRTQLRPREFLQFCKSCIEKLPSDKNIIEYNEITDAEMEYSEQKTKDLASEYRFQYPYLLSIFELFRGKKYNFDTDELDFFLLQIVSNELNVGEAKWVFDLEYSDLKKILWQIGFLKAWVIGGLKYGRKSGSSYLGYYELSQLNLENITRFQVHPAFRAYLNLKEK
jgi:hypothetical protein